MQYIKQFKEISKNDAATAGGKGASLGEMTQAGIPVPPGFVLLASAFNSFLEVTDIGVEIAAVLDTVNTAEMHTVEHASEKIQSLILNAHMPADIAAEILEAYGALGVGFVAVRSSATAEDSASAAWAGQLDSFLNTTKDTLLQNVQKCWASLFTPRAIFYRFEKGLHTQQVSVAVVVQAMVQSEVSGIAFSVHPVTQDRNQLIIEAGYGLGEAIVSGQVTPDSYVVTKHPLEIIDKNISTQDRMLVRSAEGGNVWVSTLDAVIPDKPRPGEARSGIQSFDEPGSRLGGRDDKTTSRQKLSDAQIRELSQLIIKIENHYDFPCDIEWAWACCDQFYITQSRPITTLAVTSNSQSSIDAAKEDYELSFKAKGMSVLLTDMCAPMFDILDPLLLLKDASEYYQYFHKSKLSDALEGGVQLYGNYEAFANFQNKVHMAQSKLRNIYDTHLVPKKPVTRSFLKEAFDAFIELNILYGKMNVEFTDKAYELGNTNPVVKEILQQLSLYKDEVRAFMNKALFEPDSYFSLLLFNISEQYSVPLSDLQAYTVDEVVCIPDGFRIALELGTARLQAYVVHSMDNQVHRYQGSTARDFIDAFVAEQIVDARAVRGQVACNGSTIHGRVRLIPVDYGNFPAMRRAMEAMNDGDILVAETTAPELMEACRKASAIITDLGGMMSHAAIVSRELKIPCIVGTKIATQVLHDGDLVEVDANNGVVKILEKAK